MLFSGKTDVGKKRANNQDCFRITELENGAYLFTVCDGMGGANGGNIASEVACSVFTDSIKRSFLTEDDDKLIKNAVSRANTAVFEMANSSEALKGMGTTLVSALIRSKDEITVVNVGDSRLYSITGGQIHQITRDHSYVQYLVDMGQITVKEAKNASIRNIIIRSIGNESQTSPDIFTLNAEENSYLLLCTDGLSNCVSNELICSTVTKLADKDINACTQKLIELANDGGGSDNITVILIKL